MDLLEMYLMCASRRFSPAQVPNLAGWYDASDTASLFTDDKLSLPVTADADPIAGWKDLSGTGRHLTQATAGKQFLYKVNIQNGKSAAVGDAGDSFMTMTSAAILSECTIFCACKPNASGSDPYMVGGTGPFRFLAVRFGIFTSRKLEVLNYLVDTELTATNAFTDDVNYVFAVSFSAGGNTVAIRQNGAANGSAATTDDVLSNTTDIVGAQTGAGVDSFFRNLYELIIYHRSLSLSEILQVENYLRAKWGLY